MGLGTAYIDGFKYALKEDYSYVFEMDADFSHDPKEIKNFLKAIKDKDLVLGSRYISGVNVVNWPMSRLLLSYFANAYTRIITGLPVRDATGGFKCFRREVLAAINFDNIKSNGYAFQIEMTFKAWKKGFKIGEIPITFVDRVIGKSKMSKKIVREAITMVWKLRLKSLVGSL
jgi:dolichol-phosphate mannosyltransferase